MAQMFFGSVQGRLFLLFLHPGQYWRHCVSLFPDIRFASSARVRQQLPTLTTRRCSVTRWHANHHGGSSDHYVACSPGDAQTYLGLRES
jgi:hypothetical protein